MAILILPIVDTLNVFMIRIYEGRSPFIADRNHIHHALLNLGLSHRKSTFYILMYYLGVVAVAYYFRHINVNILLAVIIALGFVGAYLPKAILLIRKQTN